MWSLQMKSTEPAEQLELNLASSSGKMSPEFSTPRTTRSDVFLEHLPAKIARSSQQGRDGRTRVVCLVPKEQSRGGYWTPNTSDWPNAAAVCLLSQVLETGLIPAKYYLSSTACAGILRRAENRGKTLPPLLDRALRSQVHSTPEPTEAVSPDHTEPQADMLSRQKNGPPTLPAP